MKLIEVPVKEKPIIFSGPMVRALLQDRKTKTRRVMQPQPVMDESGMWRWKDCQWMDGGIGFPASGIDDYAPHLPGDILWVRETFQHITAAITSWEFGEPFEDGDPHEGFLYSADGAVRFPDGFRVRDDEFHSTSIIERDRRYTPSIHMPRKAARLFLRVTDVRVEQVQDISEADARAEGVVVNDAVKVSSYKYWFKELWDGLNAKRGFGWDTNPWVWVYTFERIKTSEPQEESL